MKFANYAIRRLCILVDLMSFYKGHDKDGMVVTVVMLAIELT